MKEKNGKIIIIVMGLIIVALLCFSGYLLYDKINNLDINNNGLSSNDNDTNDNNFLTVYESANDYTTHNSNIKIKVESKNAKFIDGLSGYNMVLYYDDGIKVYRNGDVKRINLDYNESFNYYVLNDNFLVYYSDEGPKRSGIYNINNGKISFRDVYDWYEIDYTDNTSFEFGYIIAYKYKDDNQYSADVIDINNSKVIISRDNNYSGCNPAVLKTLVGEDWDDVIFTIYDTNDCGDGGRSNFVIYRSDGKIIDRLKNNEYMHVIGHRIYKYTLDSSTLIFSVND